MTGLSSESSSQRPATAADQPGLSRYAARKLDHRTWLAIFTPVQLYVCYTFLESWPQTTSLVMRGFILLATMLTLGLAALLVQLLYTTAAPQIVFVRSFRALSLWRTGDSAGAKKEFRELVHGQEGQLKITLVFVVCLPLLWMVAPMRQVRESES